MKSFIDPRILSNIQKGEIIEMGQPFYPGIPHAPSHAPFIYSMGKMHNDIFNENGVSGANDFFASGTHTGTHIDAIGHVSCNGHLHGGMDAESHQSKLDGLSILSIDDTTPIIKRGAMIDMPPLFQTDVLENAHEISPDELEAVLKKQKMDIKGGDAVFIRTGWSKYFSNPRKYLAADKGVPGVTEESAKWLVSKGMSLAGGDTIAYEKRPSPDLPVHRYLLVEKGVHIIEVLNLDYLAANKIYEFIFVCLPLRIKGGTGSPIRPIAIV